jgi:hypothetical protein
MCSFLLYWAGLYGFGSFKKGARRLMIKAAEMAKQTHQSSSVL